MLKRTYQLCCNCIMDTSDSGIVFDQRGRCDYCDNFYGNIQPNWHTDARGEAELARIGAEIKAGSRGQSHHCLLGISGGVDSSYLAHVACEKMGLKPLVFHTDAGWNSQQAVHNIERIVEGLGLDLHTEVVNWEEMKDLQLAFFKAGVPHLDTPQDHAFFAALYNFAIRHGFKYILNGGNFSTECVNEPSEWHYHASDLKQLKAIHRAHGTRPLKQFPLSDIFTYRLYYRYFKGLKVYRPLNSVPYIKHEAMNFLVQRYGWQPYAHKHYESRFTRFYEGYWLPTKFGFDKRRAHFSSLILTGQMSREEALAKIAVPAWDPETIEQDFEYIATKLDITVDELRALHKAPNRSYRDYDNNMALIQLGSKVMKALGLERSIKR
jgi:N-acetyl sugar amidotransferase